MCQHSLGRGDAEQRMQQTAIPNVDLGRFHLTLGEILKPGLQLTHEIGTGQEIKITADSSDTPSERAMKF